MICYNCGCRLSEKNFCSGCGADVTLYKKIMLASNRFYNEGLDKASVRDLSGAITSLRESLKLNKNRRTSQDIRGHCRTSEDMNLKSFPFEGNFSAFWGYG